MVLGVMTLLHAGVSRPPGQSERSGRSCWTCWTELGAVFLGKGLILVGLGAYPLHDKKRTFHDSGWQCSSSGPGFVLGHLREWGGVHLGPARELAEQSCS